MKLETPFEAKRDLIVVAAWAWGPYGELPMRLAVDTGAAATTIRPEMLASLGYNVRDGIGITRVISAIGEEEGYRQRVTRFSALEFDVLDFPVHVFDLHEDHKVDGLLGLNFLRALNYEVRSAERRILAEGAVA